MRKILYLGGFNLPNKNAAAQRVIANGKVFKELGYEVLLIGLSSNDSDISFEYDGLHCMNILYPQTIKQWIKYLTSIEQYIPFLEQKPHIVIAYNHPAIALNKLSGYCKSNGIKIIADCTEWYEPHGTWLFKLIKGWDVKKRMYQSHCKTDGVIAISKFLYDFYKERGIHTLQLPPLVDKQEAKWRQTIEQQDNIIRIIFAGSVGGGYKDRLDLIIESLERVAAATINTRIALDVIGINEDQYKKTFARWHIKPVPTFVHFHGRISHEKVIALLMNADFQLFIRDKCLANTAGFPTKFVETISAGTLVLTNESSNITDYLKEGVNGFILDNNNMRCLVESLKKPLSMRKEDITKMKKQINNSIFDYHNFTKDVKRFLDEL